MIDGYIGFRVSQNQGYLFWGLPKVRNVIFWGLYQGPLLRETSVWSSGYRV